MRHINTHGLSLLKNHEGCKLDAYTDGGGVLTIGYGCTTNVQKGLRISQEEAIRRLNADLEATEQCVERWVTVPLSENEFSALVSWTFNLGCGALRNSTLLRKLNAEDRTGARDEFYRWDHDNGKKVAGLTSRRAAEAQLFGTPDGQATT